MENIYILLVILPNFPRILIDCNLDMHIIDSDIHINNNIIYSNTIFENLIYTQFLNYIIIYTDKSKSSHDASIDAICISQLKYKELSPELSLELNLNYQPVFKLYRLSMSTTDFSRNRAKLQNQHLHYKR